MAKRTLYHYTCGHSDPHIRETWLLRPWPQIQFDGEPELIWLTDLDVPDRAGLGLTSKTLHLDRTEYRITADTSAGEALHWPAYARATRSTRDQLAVEGYPGVLPMHWWVTAKHLPVLTIVAVA